MYVEGSQNNANPPTQKRKKKQKKKRAVSHAISEKPIRGVESQKNLLTIENDRNGLDAHEAYENEQRSMAAGGYVPSSGDDTTNRHMNMKAQEQILANEEANDVIIADDLAQGYDQEQSSKMARTHNKASTNTGRTPNDTRSEMAANANQTQNAAGQRYMDIEDEQLKIENQSAL